ncbi:hypothetical protein Trihar35433_8449 [Trichoderma harzianum]|nr:hypothetical protein Trihar35433_8449 [Trichoderma harzianum]
MQLTYPITIVSNFNNYAAGWFNSASYGSQETGEAAPLIATDLDDNDTVQLLLHNGVPAEAEKKSGETALQPAAMQGQPDIVEVLLEYKANVECAVRGGEAPLHIAAKLVKIVVNRGANIEDADEDGKTPLHLAIESRHKDAARFLLKREANVNATDLSVKTPLFYAIEGLRLGKPSEFIEQLVQLLLNYGAKVQVTDNLGRTAEDVAIEKKCDSIITLLIIARNSNIVGSRRPSSLGEDEEMDDEEDDEEDEEDETTA